MEAQEWLKLATSVPRSYVASKRFRTRPMQAIIDLTMKCPASCEYCATWRIEHENLTTDQIGDILAKLRKIGVQVVAFSGGEPLIRKDVPELVRRARRLGMLASTITSGLVNKADVFRDLMESGLSTLTFTIDGIDKAMHESFRSGTSFDKVIQAVERALAVRAEHGFTTRINSQSVITRNNVHALGAIADMVRDLGVDHCSFQPVWPTTGDHDFIEKFGFDANDRELLEQARDALRAIPQANLQEYVDLLPDFYLDYPKIQRELECYAGRAFVHVDYKGDLLPCALYHESFGSLLDHEPEELLQGERYDRMLREAAAHETCGGCSLTCHMERNIMVRAVTRPAAMRQLLTARFKRRNARRAAGA
jgi:MoaA/NifB/PqqE/SkfB family radical SAM enzyme